MDQVDQLGDLLMRAMEKEFLLKMAGDMQGLLMNIQIEVPTERLMISETAVAELINTTGSIDTAELIDIAELPEDAQMELVDDDEGQNDLVEDDMGHFWLASPIE